MVTRVKCCLPGKLIRDLVLKVFTWCWSRRHLLSSIYQNSEGKHTPYYCFGVCTVSHFYQLENGEKHPNPSFPDTRQGPTLQADLSKNSSLRPVMLTSFFTGTYILTG